MLNNFHFDYDNFYVKLLEASRKAFDQLQQSYENENFYLLGLFTDAENMSIGIVGYSEEKLVEVAQKYLAADQSKPSERQDYAGLDVEEIKIYLRYQLGSDAYFCPSEFESLFAEINNSLVDRFHALFEIWSVANKLGDNQVLQELANEDEKFVKVCCGVLRQLDSEYIFGEGKERERIYLTFMNGDLNWSNKSYRDLNPKIVIERDLNEFEIAKGINEIINENLNRRQDYILKRK
jgi:hypothetical protein